MPKKKVITLPEFKTVIELIREDIKKMGEGLNHRLDKLDGRMEKAEDKLRNVKEHVGALTVEVRGVKQQVALLHEGQTEIKNSLKQKVDRDEFARLEMRVAKLENRAA